MQGRADCSDCPYKLRVSGTKRTWPPWVEPRHSRKAYAAAPASPATGNGNSSMTIPLLPMAKLAKLRIRSAVAQQGCCYYCGLKMIDPAVPQCITPADVRPRWRKFLMCTAEHLRARRDGGGDVASNVVAACAWCNSRRHLGREDRAPDPFAYRDRVRKLMAKQRWHPTVACMASHENRVRLPKVAGQQSSRRP